MVMMMVVAVERLETVFQKLSHTYLTKPLIQCSFFYLLSAVQCPNGKMFQECGSPCQLTCNNPHQVSHVKMFQTFVKDSHCGHLLNVEYAILAYGVPTDTAMYSESALLAYAVPTDIAMYSVRSIGLCSASWHCHVLGPLYWPMECLHTLPCTRSALLAYGVPTDIAMYSDCAILAYAVPTDMVMYSPLLILLCACNSYYKDDHTMHPGLHRHVLRGWLFLPAWHRGERQ
jgi:hypothetical protein